jgi:hypothetical protein
MVGLSHHRVYSRQFINDRLVVWVPDPNLMAINYNGTETADLVLKSLSDFEPEYWGLPPYQ